MNNGESPLGWQIAYDYKEMDRLHLNGKWNLTEVHNIYGD
jgi:hypothetical protein